MSASVLIRAADDPEQALETDLALNVVKARRARNAMFADAGNIFGEPSWDMLLEMYVARLQQRDLTVSSLALVSGNPMSTGLRYIQLLESKGLAVRTPHATDGRMTLVTLTESANDRMRKWLDRHRICDCGAKSGDPIDLS